MPTAMTPTRRQRFATLMRREWLQHRIGWLVLLAAPTLLLLVLLPLAGDHLLIQLSLDETDLPQVRQLGATLQTMVWSLGLTLLTLVLAVLSVLFQLPGLARRDEQDRSIEFWRSLPVSHGQAVAAQLAMHLGALPLAALLAGALGAQLVALVSIVGVHGIAAWLAQPWAALVAAGLAGLARLALGLVLAMLWLSPLLLLTMAASAWLKRWGVPLVAGLLIAGVKLVDPNLPWPLVRLTLQHLGAEAATALVTQSPLKGAHIANPEDLPAWLPDLPLWALQDAGRALAALATPGFVMALAGAGLGFALLVWRRRLG